jgi:uncharacterized protein (TIGR00255 family)
MHPLHLLSWLYFSVLVSYEKATFTFATMIRSMTGYGKARTETSEGHLQIEIKSLNSKGFDLSLRLAKEFAELEFDVRNRLQSVIIRGKVQVGVFFEPKENLKADSGLNESIERYISQLKPLAKAHQLDLSALVSAFIQSNVMRNQSDSMAIASVSEEDKLAFNSCLQLALDAYDAYRWQEGQSLMRSFDVCLEEIKDGLSQVEVLDPERIQGVRERIHKNLKEMLSEDQIDMTRFEQEMIYYLEKLDITEEKQRLAQNLRYFNETMNSADGTGRKLGFISQEIGREINTLGSKCNHFGIQQLVVNMKNALEKIKEQVLNVW